MSQVPDCNGLRYCDNLMSLRIFACLRARLSPTADPHSRPGTACRHVFAIVSGWPVSPHRPTQDIAWRGLGFPKVEIRFVCTHHATPLSSPASRRPVSRLTGWVGAGRLALAGFPTPPAEPGVRLSPHRALRGSAFSLGVTTGFISRFAFPFIAAPSCCLGFVATPGRLAPGALRPVAGFPGLRVG